MTEIESSELRNSTLELDRLFSVDKVQNAPQRVQIQRLKFADAFSIFSLSAFFKECLAFCAVIFHRLILRSIKTQFGGAFLSQSGARLS